MSGLDAEQLDELEYRVSSVLERSWSNGEGRPRGLSLREGLVVTCGYLRHNIVQEVWADIFGVHQSTISRCITFLTPLVEEATAVDRPTEWDAAEATRDAIALVDGTLWPCWSWKGQQELWAGKYRTTGHGSLIVTDRRGRVTFISEPATGNRHDMRQLWTVLNAALVAGFLGGMLIPAGEGWVWEAPAPAAAFLLTFAVGLVGTAVVPWLARMPTRRSRPAVGTRGVRVLLAFGDL